MWQNLDNGHWSDPRRLWLLTMWPSPPNAHYLNTIPTTDNRHFVFIAAEYWFIIENKIWQFQIQFSRISTIKEYVCKVNFVLCICDSNPLVGTINQFFCKWGDQFFGTSLRSMSGQFCCKTVERTAEILVNKINLKSMMLHNHPPHDPKRMIWRLINWFLGWLHQFSIPQKAIFDLSNAQRFKHRALSHQNWGWYHANVTHLLGQIMRESTFCQVSRQILMINIGHWNHSVGLGLKNLETHLSNVHKKWEIQSSKLQQMGLCS
jgi:hypothetical protein